ncbi:MAG TPA: hypothetical protein VHE79_16060 [Spirochaetia bacterium]
MRHAVLALALLCAPVALASADAIAVLQQADDLHEKGLHADARSLVLGALPSATDPKDQAELYWRASRESLDIGDDTERAKKPQAEILAFFKEGEGYADKAIAADPKNDLGYYWKSSNIGRSGQVQGVLNSLFLAQPMKDLLVKELSLNAERSDPYYVLGQLYRELPGWPVSFGNLDAAVSLGRKAIDLRRGQVQAGTEKEFVYNYVTELAKTLYKRNWSSATRIAEQKNKAAKLASAAMPLEKGSLYEATITLDPVSDRQEAKALAQSVVNDLRALPALSSGQKTDLQKAVDVLKGW